LAEVKIWGTGTPRREYLHVDDLASAVVHLLELESPPDLVNVGTGQDISILELAQLVAEVVGYEGRIALDPSMPDGTKLKRTDTTLMNDTGWYPRIGLREGLAETYRDFQKELRELSLRQR
jgi:GDP-L-fucose synthase